MFDWGRHPSLPFPRKKIDTLPYEHTEGLFNPDAQLDTSRMADLPPNNILDPTGGYAGPDYGIPPANLPLMQQQNAANQYLRSKLDRTRKEPPINKLLMLIKLLGGQ
jgi:hypothetical protein